LALGWLTATEGNQHRFGLAIEFTRNRWSWLTLENLPTFTHKLLADTDNLAFAQTHRLGDLPIRSATIRMVFVGHQQNPSTS
jgi:hypothetical protein